LRHLPLSRPDISAREHHHVRQVLASDRLALGPKLERFEALMAQQCQTRHAVAVSSGTAALHLIVRALDLGPGDEVLTTPFSFVASSNVLLYVGATPRFVDVSPTTGNLEPDALARAVTPATRAILGVDIFGLPLDWPALTDLAETHDLHLIDDACHALGATVGDRPIGAWADAASFGFYPNKQITTGEGGCITTDSDRIATRCRSLRNQGRTDDGRMEHVALGYNYRMSELEAAVGCGQLERRDDLMTRRAQVAEWYHAALAPLRDDLRLPTSPPRGTRSWFVYVIRLDDRFDDEARDMLMAALQDQGIDCAPYFPSIHLQPLYRRRFGFAPGDYPNCEALSAQTLALPFYASLAQDDVQHVAETIAEILPTLPRAATTVAVSSTDASS
jgi:perosamine synthetase